MLHVGLVIYGRIETLTGGYIYDRFLVRCLETCGCKVEIIALPQRSYIRNLWDNCSGTLRARLLEGAFDIIVQDGLTHPSLFMLNRYLKKRGDCCVVGLAHQILCCQPRSTLQNFLYRFVETRYLASLDALIFNSRTTQSYARGLLKHDCPQIVACPAGDRLGALDSKAQIAARAHRPGPLQLLFVGNLLPLKGLDRLVEALAAVPAEKWHLTVAGSLAMDAGHVRAVRDLIVRKHLSGQILLTDSLGTRDLKKHFMQSHLFLLPFSHEGFGIVYLEAMAFGLPVVGSTRGAAGETIRHGHNGFLVPPDDPACIRGYVEHLYHDRQRLTEMGEAAFDTFCAKPKWDESMESIHAFLVRLVQGKH